MRRKPSRFAVKGCKFAVPAVATVLLLLLSALGTSPAFTPRPLRAPKAATLGLTQESGASELSAAERSLLSIGGSPSGPDDACGALNGAPRACSDGSRPSAAGGSYNWTEYPSLPTGRSESLMAYDAVDGYAVLFGGFECTPTVDCGGYLNDTWAYSNGVWTNLTTTASIAPPFRPGSEMVWDGADGYVLLVTTTNTTWSFVGGVWSEIVTSNGPGNRYLPGLAYDAADG